jgi:glucose 1-dehydrogenase
MYHHVGDITIRRYQGTHTIATTGASAADRALPRENRNIYGPHWFRQCRKRESTDAFELIAATRLRQVAPGHCAVARSESLPYFGWRSQFTGAIRMKLLGKKALVTGAARGIGRGCALELARAGADVVINDRQRTLELESLAAEINQLGRQSATVDGDVFERASCDDVVARAVETLGQLDILVSNPALNRRAHFLDYDPATFEAVIRGTLTGGFHMSQLIAREMVKQGTRGSIIFIASIHDRIPYAGSVAYNAAKAGLKHMAFTIAAELLQHRIRVNVIEPGWIDTPGEESVFGRAALDGAGPTLPWGRLGTPHDIGKAAAFLASDDADYITGASLLVDGGIWLNEASKGG